VDFDDLVRLALRLLQLDPAFLDRLRQRWPYLLEDEAQDSNRLQERILRLLAGPDGNWVRVGDPNQAIYETFTTANPRYLREFISSRGVLRRDLPNSGRSTLSIITLANHLVDWTMHSHPIAEVRDALQAPPTIEPTPPGDPQPNPPDDPAQVRLVLHNYTPDGEIRAVVDNLERWLPDHPDDTVAVLVSRNERAVKVVEALERRKIEVVQNLLNTSSSTRSSARALRDVLNHLADPGSPRKLAEAYQAWHRSGGGQGSDGNVELLRKCTQVEDFLWPQPGGDWLSSLDLAGEDALAYERLLRFRELARRWQASVLLPVDQALLALAQDMFTETTDLAVAHKMALLLRRASELHPAWRLPDLSEELSVIARNERRFLGFHQDEMGFDPDRYPGKVVVATMHKAKGLEWDRVYLMSVNSYDFPSGDVHDQYISEKWFIRDHLNLEAETLEQLDAIMRTGEYQWYDEGQATLQARLDYVRERLRLLYVGITRARKELVITYNTGRKGELSMAKALAALAEYWAGRVEL
jgi:DNA helicase-2/ATP-dependent DNA helicase PcrA